MESDQASRFNQQLTGNTVDTRITRGRVLTSYTDENPHVITYRGKRNMSNDTMGI